MNAPLPHRIRRLHWQARAPTPDAAFALRSLLREGSDAAPGVSGCGPHQTRQPHGQRYDSVLTHD